MQMLMSICILYSRHRDHQLYALLYQAERLNRQSCVRNRIFALRIKGEQHGTTGRCICKADAAAYGVERIPVHLPMFACAVLECSDLQLAGAHLGIQSPFK